MEKNKTFHEKKKRACTFIHNLRVILCRLLDGFYLPFLDKVSSLFTFFKRQTYRQCRRLWIGIWFYHLDFDRQIGAWHRWILAMKYYRCHLCQKCEIPVRRKKAGKNSFKLKLRNCKQTFDEIFWVLSIWWDFLAPKKNLVKRLRYGISKL